MVKIIVELVDNVEPKGTWGQRQGHSRGKWDLEVKDGMTPEMAIQKLKKCPKFKAS
jgi:hypothetical protein